VADDYERPVLDNNQEGLFLNFLRYCLKHQSVGSVGRGKILIDAVTFLRDTSQSQGTKVLTFYGQEYVGKTWLVEDLRNLIITDKKLFPAPYKTYYMDLGGSGSSHVSLTVALIALIESIDSHVIYPTSSSVVYVPVMREAYIKAVRFLLSLNPPSLVNKIFTHS
ncbi:Putative ATP-binding protein, partial [Giardia duodenalis]